VIVEMFSGKLARGLRDAMDDGVSPAYLLPILVTAFREAFPAETGGVALGAMMAALGRGS